MNRQRKKAKMVERAFSSGLSAKMLLRQTGVALSCPYRKPRLVSAWTSGFGEGAAK